MSSTRAAPTSFHKLKSSISLQRTREPERSWRCTQAAGEVPEPAEQTDFGGMTLKSRAERNMQHKQALEEVGSPAGVRHCLLSPLIAVMQSTCTQLP